MLLAAFLPPTPRVLGFATGIITMVAMHGRMVLNVNLSVQLLLYLVGAIAFLRSPSLLLPCLGAAAWWLLACES